MDNPEHLLDGVKLQYFYQTGAAIEMAFYDGKLKYKWIAGPATGSSGQDLSYQSRKIGDDVYIVNWHETDKPDFVTLIFNLKNNVMYSSAILKYGTEKARILFEGGIVEHVQR